LEKSAWGQGSLGKVNIITLATLLPTPIIISLGSAGSGFGSASKLIKIPEKMVYISKCIWSAQ
jgi:hypothetical protein